MDYRIIDDTCYVRLDKGDEITSSLIEVCKKENIQSAIFSGIGGCSSAQIQTFIPQTGTFETRTISGMLELVSINGSITGDEEGSYYHHTHAMFSYKENGEHCVAGGHLQSVTVLYTAEIELRPIGSPGIHRKYDPETGTGFWDFGNPEE
ncbi:MAG: DUF296 domain-containing protein [Clostridia bacterium]|nr:DUF296 domain-containing protein [Clostridia bacterium]